MSKLPAKKIKELIMVIESLSPFERLEIRRENNTIEIVRKSTYKETIKLEDDNVV